MMKTYARLIGTLCLVIAPCAAHAEVQAIVAADGSIVLSNLVRAQEVAQIAASPVRATLAALPFATLVAAAAAEHRLPEALLHAVIRTESNYNPAAVSPRGALGLMQLMPATARELGVVDALDPEANIRGGARYLRRMLDLFGEDLALAVAAYNAGPGAIRRSGDSIPAFGETRRYVPKVLDHFQRLQAADPQTRLAAR